MKILVINAGSSSLKYQLINNETEEVLAKGTVERIGIKGGKLTHKAGGKEFVIEKEIKDHTQAIQLVLNELIDGEAGVIKSMDEIDAVGHRVVASGEAFKKTTLVTDEVMKTMDEIAELAPLHNPAAILGVNACRAVMPDKKMALVFDTSFHATMPDYAYLYAIDYDDYKTYQVRKYGAHGTSHKYVSQAAAEYLGKKPEELKIITCHLGNGSSISAVDGGKCIDTSMGFTPLAGVPMGTRSGDIDPAAVDYMRVKLGLKPDEVVDYLNKKCGVMGISGLSSDLRDLTAAMNDGNERAKLALEMLAYRVKKYVGSYLAVLNGADAIVFTGGIGENSPLIRGLVMSGMSYCGAVLDEKKNQTRGETYINTEDSAVKIIVCPTNEELSIARETKALTAAK